MRQGYASRRYQAISLLCTCQPSTLAHMDMLGVEWSYTFVYGSERLRDIPAYLEPIYHMVLVIANTSNTCGFIDLYNLQVTKVRRPKWKLEPSCDLCAERTCVDLCEQKEHQHGPQSSITILRVAPPRSPRRLLHHSTLTSGPPREYIYKIQVST